MLLVPMIDVADANNYTSVIEYMHEVQKNEVACVNWPELYPSRPEVAFKIAHNGTHLFLQFFVEENEILAEASEDNGPVWKDSCVEFFMSFGDSLHYYNLEVSCIAKVLLGYRENKANSEHASPALLSSIKRYPSLGTEPIGRRQGDFKWNVLIVVPVSAYWQSGLETFRGVKARGNFYKCGDNLTIPHYLSWNPVETKTPNFHMPLYFGDIYFE
ncbi:carbohydrate-binding family 9-like protein [Dysgonomonas gadei]|uniref:Carbohydrate-binding domain-containing protein n=1 Tax=Dysgonomonas gadei ATCC BAA-286 TaxID=742766 RepID=F5IZV6_9BACT|nr:carbohydrate-binding family 9-like protein [Dysgonomonas gadei]EGK01101.1 hypothetical protein HMPREF9455_02623 [Dysgonomonas gadei ATCC BAA-286]